MYKFIDKSKQIQKNFIKNFEQSFEDLNSVSTTYTHSPEYSLPGSQTELDEIIQKSYDDEDFSSFDDEVYEQAEDFLDREGLFISSASPVFKPRKLNLSLGTIENDSLEIFRKNNSQCEEKTEKFINTCAVPSFISRRKVFMRKLTV